MPYEHPMEQEEIENVRVVVRSRPMDKSELQNSSLNVVKVDKINRSITVIKPNATPNEPPKTYFFDNVFGDDSSQTSNEMANETV